MGPFWAKIRRRRDLYPQEDTAVANSQQPFLYFIDSPGPDGEISTPFVEISGWIASPQRQQIRQPVLISSRGRQVLLSVVPRPDVKKAHPEFSVLGFHRFADLADITPEDSWSVKFTLGAEIFEFPVSITVPKENHRTFSAAKEAKLQEIQKLLQCPHCRKAISLHSENELFCNHCSVSFDFDGRRFSFLAEANGKFGYINPTTQISSHEYDPVTLGLIERYSNGLILDNGCGLRKTYYGNVVNFDVLDLPTTDVVGTGENLPFADQSFDAVFSLSVLEHVRNPFLCAQEILRVLKQGGILYAAVPFLQPVHAFPNHYYNMTHSGVKNLFSGKLEFLDGGVERWGLPIWTLTWFLNSYISGLPEDVAAKFKQTKVGNLLGSADRYLEQDFVERLSHRAKMELASTTFFIGRKK